MGLPRNQVNEKCGPKMLPPDNHWQPTEFFAVFTSPGTRVCEMTSWSLIPPHSGKNGPWVAFPCAAEVCGTSPGLVGSESEHAANTGMIATAATASTLAFRLVRVARVVEVTPCTVAAGQKVNHRHAG